MRHHRCGLTLVELCLVLAIIGLITSFLTVNPGPDSRETMLEFAGASLVRLRSECVTHSRTSDGVEAVLVTDEPPGGSEAPTTTPVIQASPA